MKTAPLAKLLLFHLIGALVALATATTTLAQGTITFNNAASFSGTDYYELGVWFHVVIPQGGPSHDDMAGVPGGGIYGNLPNNATPFMIFLRQNNPYDYVVLSFTNGSAFGLTSVSLADPNSPSSLMLPITFLGFRTDGSTVTNAFTTPGNGADHLLSYQFNPDFASDLLSVEIHSARWAMDNLVFVPEPGARSLLGLALLSLAAWSIKGRRQA